MIMKKLIGILAGAVILFVWGFVCWAVSPLHSRYMKTFKDEAAVAKVLTEQTPEAGYYRLPNLKLGRSEQDHAQAWDKGPMLIGVVRPGAKEHTGMGRPMAFNFLNNLAICALLAVLLSRAQSASLASAVGLGAAAGVLVTLAGHVPSAIWFETPVTAILSHLVENAVGLMLAALPVGWGVRAALKA
jgi:hypothetical protein